MSLVNTYRKHEGLLVLVLSVLAIAAWIALAVYAHVWSFGLLAIAIILMVLSVTKIGSRLEARVDRQLLFEDVSKVERKFFGLTYNGKQLKHYTKVRLTHSPKPYADERKKTLWLHPTHFAVDAGALEVWQANGGIITEEK